MTKASRLLVLPLLTLIVGGIALVGSLGLPTDLPGTENAPTPVPVTQESAGSSVAAWNETAITRGSPTGQAHVIK